MNLKFYTDVEGVFAPNFKLTDGKPDDMIDIAEDVNEERLIL